MGTGTRFKHGILDGVATTEGGSASLVAGATTVTVGLDSITAAVAANSVTAKASPKVTWTNKSLTIAVDGSSTHKVFYLAVGPRTTKY